MTDLEIQKQKTLGIQVQTYAECMQFAEAVSNSDMVPKSYKGSGKTKEQIKADLFVAIAMGQELGLSPMAAIQGIATVNGMPTVWGDVMLGIVHGSKKIKHIREWAEGDWEKKNYVAWCETLRVGALEPVITSFTYEDAKRANLIGKAGSWTSHPLRMMKYKARSFNLRDNFPDVLKGIHSKEEMEGETIDVGAAVVQKKTSFFEESQPEALPPSPDDPYQVFRDTIDGFTLEQFKSEAPAFFAEIQDKLPGEVFLDLRFYGVERMKKLQAEQSDEQTSLPTE